MAATACRPARAVSRPLPPARAVARLRRPGRRHRGSRHLRALAGGRGRMTAHHDHGIDGHRHPHQPDIEDRPFEYYQVMAEAVGELLIEKGVLSARRVAPRDRGPGWPQPGARRQGGGARLGRSGLPGAPARERQRRRGRARHRCRQHPDPRGREHRRPAQRDLLHALLLLSAAAARRAAGLVQVARLSLARGARAARRAGRVRHAYRRRCRGPRARQHGRSALPGPAGASGRQRGAGARTSWRRCHPRLHDRHGGTEPAAG